MWADDFKNKKNENPFFLFLLTDWSVKKSEAIIKIIPLLSVLGRIRECKTKGRPFSLSLRVCKDVSTMHFDNIMDDWKSKSCPSNFGIAWSIIYTVKPVKDFDEISTRDTHPLVADWDKDIFLTVSTEMVITPPLGEYLKALLIMLSTTWAILSVSISTQMGRLL